MQPEQQSDATKQTAAVAPVQSEITANPVKVINLVTGKLLFASGIVGVAAVVAACIYTYSNGYTLNSFIEYFTDPEAEVPVVIERPLSFSYDFDPSTDFNIADSDVVTEPKEPGYSLRHDPVDYSNLYSTLLSQRGVVWKYSPYPLGDIGYIQATEGNDWWQFQPLDYFQIGTYDGAPIIYVEVPCDGMCGANDYIVFVGTPEEGVRYITKHSSYPYEENYYKFQFPSYITIDTQTEFSALKLEPIVLDTVTLVNDSSHLFGKPGISSFFANSAYNQAERDGWSEVVFVRETAQGPLFRMNRTTSEYETVDMSYAIRLPGGLMAPYEYPLDFLGDDRVPKVTWLDGSQNITPYRMDGLTSCGGGGPEVYQGEFASDDLIAAGITAAGETIYNVVNPSHPLIARVFGLTDGMVYEYNSETGEQRTYRISTNEFIANRGVLIYKDPLGLNNVLVNGTYGPQAECAKPVVYLYPEATTTVSVAVDALVTKSDPVYSSGWNVIATPEGALQHQGSWYTSLFWDGYGNGTYPTINEGFVVPTNEALEHMAEHLSYMGFTEREIADFTDFWEPHLPRTAYTEFRWLQTADMERLAKLTIQPRPDTLLRAFVEFTGRTSPVVLAPQKLQRIERRGFVATEWGGLLKK